MESKPEKLLLSETELKRFWSKVDRLGPGSNADNAADKIQKGRANAAKGDATGARKHPDLVAKGEALPFSKLNGDTVRLIRAAYQNGSTILGLAKHYGVDRHSIRCAIQRKTWKHIA